MISRFFIDRPIFAWVIAIAIAVVGCLSIPKLPVAQYPSVVPPSVSIQATYPGASGEIVEKSVTQLIEQQLSALDGYLYMTGSSNSNGQANIQVSFEPGTDPDTAAVQVQNRVQQAMPRLPQQVQQQGVQVRKASSTNALIIAVYDTSGKLRSGDLSDFLNSNLQDPVSRITGVGDIQIFGGQYAMRIWLDPFKLASFNLVPTDVQAAIQNENVQVSAGQIGAQPAVEGQRLSAIVNAQSRFTSVDQFRAILLRTNPDGSTVRLQDVARVELGAENYNFAGRYNGFPSSAIAIRLTPEANALETIEEVKATVEGFRSQFPPNVQTAYPIDTSPFVAQAIQAVVLTLLEGIVLVVVVIFLFLQSWRATLIPAIAVPVVLLGTFGVLHLMSLSINMLTMFGMVLAIGLLVDDAIVVVENVERLMHDENLSPRDATRRSMDEITGALVGIAVVLSAVFLPMAFFGGATGIIYRQFSITIVAAMALSLLVALVLTPALCATLLRPHDASSGVKTTGFFGWFNRMFARGRTAYEARVQRMIPRRALWFAVYGVICVAMVVLFVRTPTGFLPDEDQGRVMVQYTLPEGSTLEQTVAVANRVADYLMNVEKKSIDGVFAVPGFSNSGNGQNQGQAFTSMKDWSERTDADSQVFAVSARTTAAFAQDRQARIFSTIPPSVPELGNSAGFDLQLQNATGMTHDEFLKVRERFIDIARKDPLLSNVRYNGIEDQPQLQIRLDRAKAGALGISQQDVNTLMATALGGAYVNDFIDGERVKRVFVQADAPFRMKPEDIGLWNLRTNSGSMAPFSSVASYYWTYGPLNLNRYNGLPSFNIQGAAAPGVSSGTALDRIEQIVRDLNAGVTFAWSGLSYQERLSSGQSLPLYAISLLVVFLALAALYESWVIPASVLLVVPLGIIGAVIATDLRGLENGIFFQVGLLTTMGLAAKNAILIVEFAAGAEKRGLNTVDATLQGSRLRLRPILMTSLAFMAGTFPLVIANGAGAGSQNAIGTAVIGGMLSGAALSVFFVPVFYVAVRSLAKR
ncbi:MAG TPA: efflux RND transporter permease subunit [Steroidobacteraceae bacterium]|nr:efflux RND transporter permease subunit [Steroidobacteraceae bacterium]